MRQQHQVDRETGRRAGATSPRRAAGIAVVAVLMFFASAAATPLDDLLSDLRFVPLDGQPAPQFTLPDLDGKPVSLDQFHGRVVLLYFWATW